MTALIIPAPPGYWFLALRGETDKDDHPELVEGPVIAWQINDNGQIRQPIAYADFSDCNWDSALELPDGRCINDANDIYADRAAWLDQSLANYQEARREDTA